MKKLVLLATVFIFHFANAQETTDNQSALSKRKNELRFDLVSVITKTRFHISYERFLNKDFSAGLSASISQSSKNKDEFEENFNRTLPEYEIIPYARYSLSKSEKNYYYVEVFASANGGKYKEQKRLPNSDNTSAIYTAVDDNYFDVALGGAVGYKLYFKEKIAIDLFIGMGKNLFNTDVSPELVPRVGASIGYRF